MAELDNLYQDIILDHNRRPRNFAALSGATAHAEGKNPLCGDQVEVFTKVEGDVLAEVTFQGSGCAISRASASLMTAAVKGKTRTEAATLADQVHQMVTGTGPAPEGAGLASLKALSGVHKFPARVKCASLAWHTLKAALDQPVDGAPPVVSTE